MKTARALGSLPPKSLGARKLFKRGARVLRQRIQARGNPTAGKPSARLRVAQEDKAIPCDG